MKQSFVKGIKNNALLIIAVVAFVIFEGNKKIENNNEIASRCCTGYCVSLDKLKKFMLDSLHSNRFEGGVFSKAKLIAAINAVAGDSVYLMTVLPNCDATQSNDLVFTSPQTNGVVYASKPNCQPCPPKSCCTQKVGITSTDRSCLNFKTSKGLSDVSTKNKAMAAE